MKSRVLVSMLVIGLIAGLVGAATWAYFSDVETSSDNTFTAGTLNLQVGDSDPTTVQVTLSNMYPGQSGAYDWALKNTGTIAGSLDITFSNLVDDENGCNEPEALVDGTCGNPGAGEGELDTNLSLTIYIDENDNDVYDSGTDTLVYQGDGAGIAGEKLSNYDMAASYNKSIRLEYSIAGTVGNIVQSDSAGFDIEFELLQAEGAD